MNNEINNENQNMEMPIDSSNNNEIKPEEVVSPVTNGVVEQEAVPVMPVESVQSPVQNIEQPVQQAAQVMPQMNQNNGQLYGNNIGMNQGMYQQQPMQTNNGMLGNNPLKQLDPKVLIAAGAGFALIVLIILILLLSGGSKSVVKKYSRYYVNGSYEKFDKILHEDYVKKMEKYLSEDYEDMMKEQFKYLKDKGIIYKKYDIIDKNKLNKDQLEDLREDLEDSYDINEKDVKGAVQYLIKFTIDNANHPAVDYEEVTAVKIKGKWYLFAEDYYNN